MKKPVNIYGRLRKVVTISELAKMVSRQTITLRKYEERGILPPANFRMPSKKTKSGKAHLGDRLYTLELAVRLKEILGGVSQGVPITDEQKRLIREAFQNELINAQKQTDAKN